MDASGYLYTIATVGMTFADDGTPYVLEWRAGDAGQEATEEFVYKDGTRRKLQAEAFGLGIAAWSPLKSGLLAGRYRRGDTSAIEAGDGRASFVARALDERALTVLDEVIAIAEVRGVPVAHVALAWLHAQPRVQMILMGPSSVKQLEDTVNQMEAVTQKNASLVEETTATIASVDEQVDTVVEVAGFFTGGGEATQSQPRLKRAG